MAGAGEQVPVVSVRGVTKRFPGVVALDRVSLEVLPGEIHAVLGENGAGKSTLAKILYGVYTPDEGEILVEGRRVALASPRDAMRAGIAMVSQRPQLVEELSVAENIALSLEDLGAFSSMGRIVEYSQRFVEKFGLGIDVEKPVWTLGYTQRQMVELLKALVVGARLVILDEATTYLPKAVRAKLYGILRSLRLEGRGILFITHKIGEALDLADRITV
ncbi:MAG: ABC transporter, partial [Thermoprotei archaeon]